MTALQHATDAAGKPCQSSAAAAGLGIDSCCAAQELREQAVQDAAMAAGLTEECQRLRNHIADLETRKRAPLYQKKQEEELKVHMQLPSQVHAWHAVMHLRV